MATLPLSAFKIHEKSNTNLYQLIFYCLLSCFLMITKNHFKTGSKNLVTKTKLVKFEKIKTL